jgi:hypothetical protein
MTFMTSQKKNKNKVTLSYSPEFSFVSVTIARFDGGGDVTQKELRACYYPHFLVIFSPINNDNKQAYRLMSERK